MVFLRLIIPLTAICFLIAGCRKEHLSDKECDKIKESIKVTNAEALAKQVDHLLVGYTRENLEKFASSLSSKCDITATLDCFSCIETGRPQSHIKFSVNEAGSVVEKFLDVSYDDNNRMILLRIH